MSKREVLLGAMGFVIVIGAFVTARSGGERRPEIERTRTLELTYDAKEQTVAAAYDTTMAVDAFVSTDWVMGSTSWSTPPTPDPSGDEGRNVADDAPGTVYRVTARWYDRDRHETASLTRTVERP